MHIKKKTRAKHFMSFMKHNSYFSSSFFSLSWVFREFPSLTKQAQNKRHKCSRPIKQTIKTKQRCHCVKRLIQAIGFCAFFPAPVFCWTFLVVIATPSPFRVSDVHLVFIFFIAKKIVCNHEEEPHQQRNTKPAFSASPVETERAHEHVRGRFRKRRRSESSECFQVSDSPPLSSVSADPAVAGGQRNGTGHQTSRLPWAVFEFCLSGWHEGCWPALFEWPGFCWCYFVLEW